MQLTVQVCTQCYLCICGVLESPESLVYAVNNSIHWYCAYHVLVQPNFRPYYFYFLADQAQIPLDYFNVLDELGGEISTGFDNR